MSVIHWLLSHQHWKMACVCPQREFMEKPFSSWIKCANNLYVGRNLHQYSKGAMSNSKWCADHIFSQHQTKSIMTKLYFYETYVRENLFSNLPELYVQRLGCFCPPWQACHVDVLLRLLYESLEDASRKKEDNDEQTTTTTVATTSLPTPKTVSFMIRMKNILPQCKICCY